MTAELLMKGGVGVMLGSIGIILIAILVSIFISRYSEECMGVVILFGCVAFVCMFVAVIAYFQIPSVQYREAKTSVYENTQKIRELERKFPELAE